MRENSQHPDSSQSDASYNYRQDSKQSKAVDGVNARPVDLFLLVQEEAGTLRAGSGWTRFMLYHSCLLVSAPFLHTNDHVETSVY